MIKTHKPKFFVLPGIIIFAILIFSVAFIMMPRAKPDELIKEDDFNGMLKDGDIICRLGDRLWSEVFKDFSIEDKRFSHTGIIRINNDKITVIHAEGTTKPGKDFVKEEPLADFLKVARTAGIYRLKDFDAELQAQRVAEKISAMAMEYLGLPFDWKFDMSDASELYCTELLYIILKQIMPELEFNTIYIKELGRDIVPIDSISNSEYFLEVFFTK